MRNPFTWIGEMVWGTTSAWGATVVNGLRNGVRGFDMAFWGTRPVLDKTVVTYELARQLYRNDGADTLFGGGFCRAIIDLNTAFIGIPMAASGDDDTDTFLNACFSQYWTAVIQQMLRSAMRDSKTFVRVDQPRLTNPLVSEDERMHMRISTLEPERVKLIYAVDDADFVEKGYVTHFLEFEDDVNTDVTDPRQAPKIREHEIVEVITPLTYRFFDKTDQRWIDSWGRSNPWGFVPIAEVWNEYDSALSGGQSEFEPVLPFIKAFHEVLKQGLDAHAYHSMPKLKLKVKQIVTFLANNFPETLDENLKVKPQTKIRWKGREALLFEADEDAEFLEVTSILGDTKTLLEFLIDCISIASQTPEWAFMRVESGTSQGAMNAQTLPFERKIDRKRIGFTPNVQRIAKMALKMAGRTPETVTLKWPDIRPETMVNVAQAFQQLMAGIDVARNAKLMSDATAVSIIGQFFPELKSPESEIAAAEDNFLPDLELAQAQQDLAEKSQQDQAAAAKLAARRPPAGSATGNGGTGRTTTAASK